MATRRRSGNEESVQHPPKARPATTPEARENQIISSAYNLAEKQIQEGTASSQVITHFLKMGSSREAIEKEKLELEKNVLKAKAEMMESHKRIEELYGQALAAMRSYAGQPPEQIEGEIVDD